jgi:nicotinamide mononucleotide transporter
MVLQFFYLGMTIYGWYFWVFGGHKKNTLQIRHITKPEIIVFTALTISLTVLSGFLFKRYTSAVFPYWDSFLLVGGIIATYAMAKKIFQHWLMWIILDINAAILYFIKDLYAFTILYFLFIILAIIGHFRWKKDMSKIKTT